MDKVVNTTENINKEKAIIYQDQDILELEKDKLLEIAIKKLPQNYNFEIKKSIVKVKQIQSELGRKAKVSLQMPDGFMHLSLLLSDIIEKFTACETFILGDTTYGACCIDDIGSKMLEADFIIHYGHSCLIPVTETLVKTLYVFVDIAFDIEHCVETIKFNFPNKEENMFISGSIQFNNSVFLVKKALKNSSYTNIVIPQAKPRSNGEVLGCTSPNIDIEKGIVIFICDGRFHMESLMIANPQLTFYQYNPFTKVMTLEEYDTMLMLKNRKNSIQKCKNAKRVGILFGILGRQGNKDLLHRIIKLVNKHKLEYDLIMFSEIKESYLDQFPDCDFFIQLACPRLSIDWGIHFSKPVISTYEAYVVFNETQFIENKYPMDFYAYDGGEWSNFHGKGPVKKVKNKEKVIINN